MKIVSLFAGCGGLDLGFERAGFTVVWANEFDATIHETFRINHPNTILNTSDIRDLSASDIPDCDGIIGGPPCQSWSLGGKCLGIDDERGKLVYDYIRIVEGKHPKFFIMENVAGMVSERHMASFRSFLKMFQDIGYNVKYELMNAADYEIPQDRQRIIIVGIRNDIDSPYVFPPAKTDKHVTLAKAIGNINEPPRPYLNETVDNHYTSILNHDYFIGEYDKKFMARNRVRAWDEVSYTIQAQAKNEPLHPQAPKMVYITDNERTFKKGYEHLYRRLSVRECARIQSFPDSFRFVYSNVQDGYKMVGNAVPPRLAYYLAVSIKECLKKAANESILIGYVKSEKDLINIRKQNVYYVRGGNRPGALSFGQLDHSIKWLLLHRNGKRYYFELYDKNALECNHEYLKKLGFSPQGNIYWLFQIKRELSQAEIHDSLGKISTIYTKKPQILNIQI